MIDFALFYEGYKNYFGDYECVQVAGNSFYSAEVQNTGPEISFALDYTSLDDI